MSGWEFRHINYIFTVRNEVAKVMFLQASVCPRGGGCLPQCMLGYHTPGSRHPPGADPPQSRHPLAVDTPGADTPLPWEQTPPSRHPPRADTPRADTEAATAADGTHPTGMHSCLGIYSRNVTSLSVAIFGNPLYLTERNFKSLKVLVNILIVFTIPLYATWIVS